MSSIIEKLGIDHINLEIAKYNAKKLKEIERIAGDYGLSRTYLMMAKRSVLFEEMLEALIIFCQRVDRYEVRSKRTYAQFKAIIEKATGKKWEEIKEIIND